MRTRAVLAAAFAAALPLAAPRAQAPAPQLQTEDLFVPYTSTSPADAGQVTALHVLHVRHEAGPNAGPVVLFVHGATGPGVPDFDLDYKDYNWMANLARVGFDTYAVDLYGYGSSYPLSHLLTCSSARMIQG